MKVFETHVRVASGSEPGRAAFSERGSVSVISIAMIGGILALTGCIAGISAAFAVKQRIVGAADAAAVAAADVVSGAMPGYPCARADDAASINGATMVDCVINGPSVSVLVKAQILTFEVRVRARAGPPRTLEPFSVEDGLEVAVFDGARPAVEGVVGSEFHAATPCIEVALAARLSLYFDSRARVTRLQELGSDGFAFQRTIGQFRGIRPHRCCTHEGHFPRPQRHRKVCAEGERARND